MNSCLSNIMKYNLRMNTNVSIDQLKKSNFNPNNWTMNKKSPQVSWKSTFLLCMILICFSLKTKAQNLDIDLLRKINVERNTALDPTFKFVTNSVSPIGIAAPLIVTSIGYLEKNKNLHFFINSIICIFIWRKSSSGKCIKL